MIGNCVALSVYAFDSLRSGLGSGAYNLRDLIRFCEILQTTSSMKIALQTVFSAREGDIHKQQVLEEAFLRFFRDE